MILVDTSVWIDFFRGSDTPQSRYLAAALDQGEGLSICGLVVTEILQGVRDNAQHRAVSEALEPLDYLPTVRDAYPLAADIYRAARRKGKAIRGTVDCVIAACAILNDVGVLHRDRDYEILAAVSDLRVVAVT